MLDAGVTVVMSSDYPIEVINPLWGLQRAVTRQELDGSPPWQPEDALSVEEALRAMTWGQAYASREEGDRGTLSVGMRADVAVLREDPFVMDASSIAASTVLMTIVNGKVTFEGAQSYPPPVPWASSPAST